MIVVKFSTLAGGVWIEQPSDPFRCEYEYSDRVFRESGGGNMEWAQYGDVVRDGELVRWYHFQIPETEFVFA